MSVYAPMDTKAVTAKVSLGLSSKIFVCFYLNQGLFFSLKGKTLREESIVMLRFHVLLFLKTLRYSKGVRT